MQSLNSIGNPDCVFYIVKDLTTFLPVRLGYRWCRKPLPTLGQVAMETFIKLDAWNAADADIRADWERAAAAVVKEYEARKTVPGKPKE